MHNYDTLINKEHVICGSCSLARAGLTTYSATHLDLMTTYHDLDGVCLSILTYYYNPKIDYEFCVSPAISNPLLLQPTKERALVEYILNEKWMDEGVLIEALSNYLEYFRDDAELNRVAKHFGLKMEILGYWIDEALEELGYGVV